MIGAAPPSDRSTSAGKKILASSSVSSPPSRGNEVLPVGGYSLLAPIKLQEIDVDE